MSFECRSFEKNRVVFGAKRAISARSTDDCVRGALNVLRFCIDSRDSAVHAVGAKAPVTTGERGGIGARVEAVAARGAPLER